VSFPIFRISIESKAEAALKVVSICSDKFSEDLMVKKLTANIVKKVDEVQNSLAPKSEKEITAKLREMDIKRDDAYRALISLIKAYAIWSDDAGKNENASLIYHRLMEDKLGFLSGGDLEETIILKEKIDYLSGEEAKNLVEGIGAKTFLENLMVCNNNFVTLYEQRLDKKEQRPVALNELEIPLNKAINVLKGYISSFYSEEKLRIAFQPFIDADATARAKITRKKNQETEE
jgi:Family of unknown function (DUF6261)